MDVGSLTDEGKLVLVLSEKVSFTASAEKRSATSCNIFWERFATGTMGVAFVSMVPSVQERESRQIYKTDGHGAIPRPL